MDRCIKCTSISIFIYKKKQKGRLLVVVCNFNKGKYEDFKIGVPENCEYVEVFNSDRDIYGGSNFINDEIIKPKKRNGTVGSII
ncbi:alpha amylase C-terminal domain-containing protein [Caloramator sp. mosi_1]|nr:alpha amylase C-terminal domain-containing protein [Caloramator sp. mosi_1]WDC85125.1 alpha amylase C-terminal domain-containing protein [Caloramator sp. mosi_1]